MLPRVELAPGYTISCLLKGGWQLAGGHGRVDAADALADMDRFVDAGITTFDCADIYTGVEALIGGWLKRRRARGGAAPAGDVQVHTKYVPDLDRLPTHSRADVVRGVDRSLARLGVECLDLVQLHWWDYDVPGYVDAVAWLDELRRAGKIRHVGLTNFDQRRLAEIIAAGVPVVSHQVQYSVLDRRPANGLAVQCARHGVGLLCYGALAGGFLSDRYLGRPDPAPPLENRSLVKYRLIIEEFGGWERFQDMLAALRQVAAPSTGCATRTAARSAGCSINTACRASSSARDTRGISGRSCRHAPLGWTTTTARPSHAFKPRRVVRQVTSTTWSA